MLTRPSKKRYKERIIKITEDLREEDVTDEYLALKKLKGYAGHQAGCPEYTMEGVVGRRHNCRCGYSDALKEGG